MDDNEQTTQIAYRSLSLYGLLCYSLQLIRSFFLLNLNCFATTLDMNSNFIIIAIINRRCMQDVFPMSSTTYFTQTSTSYICTKWWYNTDAGMEGGVLVISGHLRRAVSAVRPDVIFRESGRTGDDRRLAVVLRTPMALRALAQCVGAHFVHVRPLLHGEQTAGLLALTTHLLQKKRRVKLMSRFQVAWLNQHCSIQ